MQILIFVCLCAGSWASLEDDKLSLLQRTVSRRSHLISPDKRCEAATSCKIALSKVTKNDLDKGGEIRYSEACVEKGEKVDLVVTTSSDYVTKKPWLNGLKGPYGNINLNHKLGMTSHFPSTSQELQLQSKLAPSISPFSTLMAGTKEECDNKSLPPSLDPNIF